MSIECVAGPSQMTDTIKSARTAGELRVKKSRSRAQIDSQSHLNLAEAEMYSAPRFSAPYDAFVNELADLLSRARDSGNEIVDESVRDALGGGAYRALRELIGIDHLRDSGAFFTSPEFARILWSDSLDSLDSESVVVDPACGAGDLLLPAAVHLLEAGASEGLYTRIRGTDREESFVGAARARLRLASLRGVIGAETGDFLGVKSMDFLLNPAEIIAGATHVVLNPPFSNVIVSDSTTWARGSTNAAAVFIDLCLEHMPVGSRLLAILPEVLKSGTRYERWRERTGSRTVLNSIRELGQFDSKTDVHVFALDVTKVRDESIVASSWWAKTTGGQSDATVGDHFEVKVGSVVPHRHSEEGAPVKYLSARDIAPWEQISTVKSQRRFSGRLDTGPVVLVRRTSRPGELYRARGTIVTDTDPVAYENHLIVLKPRDGTIASCERLLENLRDPKTTLFLDSAIKLRHLTVSSVRNIPWHAGKSDE